MVTFTTMESVSAVVNRNIRRNGMNNDTWIEIFLVIVAIILLCINWYISSNGDDEVDVMDEDFDLDEDLND